LKIRETALGMRHLHRAEELARSAAETLERSVPGLIRAVPARYRGSGTPYGLASHPSASMPAASAARTSAPEPAA
jgi:hypothetical protein